MLTREEKARQLLHAMTEIEDRYIAEAAPENTERSAASEGAVETATLAQMKHADVEKMNMDAQKEAEAPAKADMPDEDRHSEPKVLYMKPQKRWKLGLNKEFSSMCFRMILSVQTRAMQSASGGAA